MISLITAAYGRSTILNNLLSSLRAQTYKDFEIIIVDQNDHNEIERIIQNFKDLSIVYVRSERKGLSYNRNIGLKYARGDVYGFPDDDCYYDSNVLKKVHDRFLGNDKGLKLVAVEVKDPKTGNVWITKKDNIIRRKHLYDNCVSINFFIKKEIGMAFDELLGVGAKFGSGEETDFLWEYFAKSDYGLFINNTYIYHLQQTGPVNDNRAYNYGLGYGAIFKKEILKRRQFYMIFYYLRGIVRSLGGIILKKEHGLYYKSLKGRILGFVKYS